MAPRLALLTGAAGGIGLELAKLLDQRGFEVIHVELTSELAQQARQALGSGIAVSCDLSDRGQVAELVSRVETEWADDLEVIVANAGIIVPNDVVDTAATAFDRQLDLMLGSVIQLLAAGARVLKPRGRGHLLATVSMGAVLAMEGSTTYSAAKFGLRAFLTGLQLELRGSGVKVSGVYPSAVDTTMLYHEATHGGSLLNFVGKVSTSAEVAKVYAKALDTGRLESYVPYGDSLFCRVLQAVPWAIAAWMPLLNRLGEAGRKRYLRSTVSGPQIGRP